MQATNTLLFKDAVGSNEDFANSDVAKTAILNMQIYIPNSDGEQEILESSDWVNEVYRILLRHYRNSEIAFENVDAFLDILWERIEVHAPNYFQQKAQYNRLLQLSDDELIDGGINIVNITENTNDRAEKVFEPLKNITNQQATKDNFSKAQGIRNQIYNAKMDIMHVFLRKFEGLFIRLGSRVNLLSVYDKLRYTE